MSILLAQLFGFIISCIDGSLVSNRLGVELVDPPALVLIVPLHSLLFEIVANTLMILVPHVCKEHIEKASLLQGKEVPELQVSWQLRVTLFQLKVFDY